MGGSHTNELGDIAVRRLNNELLNSQEPDISLQRGNNPSHIIGTINCLEENIIIDIDIPSKYPFDPPKMKLRTPLTDNNGTIILDRLDIKWSSALTIKSVLQNIKSLIIEKSKFTEAQNNIFTRISGEEFKIPSPSVLWLGGGENDTKRQSLGHIVAGNNPCVDIPGNWNTSEFWDSLRLYNHIMMAIDIGSTSWLSKEAVLHLTNYVNDCLYIKFFIFEISHDGTFFGEKDTRNISVEHIFPTNLFDYGILYIRNDPNHIPVLIAIRKTEDMDNHLEISVANMLQMSRDPIISTCDGIETGYYNYNAVVVESIDKFITNFFPQF